MLSKFPSAVVGTGVMKYMYTQNDVKDLAGNLLAGIPATQATDGAKPVILAFNRVSSDGQYFNAGTHTITVMYSGQFIEAGTTEQIFNRPYHPYTKALLDSSPKANIELPLKSRLTTLPGSIPVLQHLPIGCRLGPRCPRAQKICVQAPKTTNHHGHLVNCHYSLKETY